MSFELNQALSPAGFDRASKFLVRLLLSTNVAAIWPSALESASADVPTTQQATKLSSPPEAASSLCEALGTAAATHDLPADFFIRLIWQESRFKPDAVSRAGAQGVAQFMPETARLRGLENPFNPLEAITKSAELLRDLRREFGNLGLAAAAYNAGSGRVRDWLAGRRPLPSETRAYVRLVTDHSVEEWTGAQSSLLDKRSLKAVPCNMAAATSVKPNPDSSLREKTGKPWGVEVVGGSTTANALARYREWRAKYLAIIGDRETQVVISGIIGNMGAARVRVGADTRLEAEKMCAALRGAGTYCDVLHN